MYSGTTHGLVSVCRHTPLSQELFAPDVVEDDFREVVPGQRWVEVLQYVGVDRAEGAMRTVLHAVVVFPARGVAQMRSTRCSSTRSTSRASRRGPSTRCDRASGGSNLRSITCSPRSAAAGSQHGCP